MSMLRARVGSRVPEHVYLDGRPLMTAASAAQAAEVVNLLNTGARALKPWRFIPQPPPPQRLKIPDNFPGMQRPTAAQAAPLSPADPRPQSCTMRLRDEGKAAPRSGCASCHMGGMLGCPHERKATT